MISNILGTFTELRKACRASPWRGSRMTDGLAIIPISQMYVLELGIVGHPIGAATPRREPTLHSIAVFVHGNQSEFFLVKNLAIWLRYYYLCGQNF